MIWQAPKIWKDEECWIIGGGSSFLYQFGVPDSIIKGLAERKIESSECGQYLLPIHDKHVIGVNNAYRIGNWIDVLFFGDASWHLVHGKAVNVWPGLRVTCSPKFANYTDRQAHGIKYLQRDPNKTHGITRQTTKLSWNNNSGAAAINLGYHFGAVRILLLGFDMALSPTGSSHWHGSHQPLGKKITPPFSRHLRGFPAIAEDAKKLGIEILNVNPNSKIDVFKKVSLRDVL